MTIQVMMFGGTNPIVLTGLQSSFFSNTNPYFAAGTGFDSSQNIYTTFSNLNANGLWVINKINSAGTNQWFSNGTPSAGSSQNNPWSSFKNLSVDTSGNVYGNNTFSNTAGSVTAGYLQKINTSGTIQWQRKLTNAGNDVKAQSTVIDAGATNVYVGGTCTIASATAFWLAKYNSSGVIQWQRQITGSGISTFGMSITSDSSSNVYLVGTGNSAAVIFKYNSSGTLQWQKQLTSTSGAYSVSTDGSSNVYVTFGFSGFIGVAKIDSTGASITWQFYVNTAFVVPQWIVTDSAGSSWGYYFNGSSTTYVSNISTTGTLTWTNTLTGVGNQGGLALDATNSYLYISHVVSSTQTSSTVFRLPTDGSKTVGTLTNLGTTSTQAYNASTPSSTTNPGISIFSGSLTDAAGALTDAAGDLTITTTNPVSQNAATF